MCGELLSAELSGFTPGQGRHMQCWPAFISLWTQRTCRPHPPHVVFPQDEHFVAKHMTFDLHGTDFSSSPLPRHENCVYIRGLPAAAGAPARGGHIDAKYLGSFSRSTSPSWTRFDELGIKEKEEHYEKQPLDFRRRGTNGSSPFDYFHDQPNAINTRQTVSGEKTPDFRDLAILRNVE
ncbi:unnamed protein product [Victoria cruziana]